MIEGLDSERVKNARAATDALVARTARGESVVEGPDRLGPPEHDPEPVLHAFSAIATKGGQEARVQVQARDRVDAWNVANRRAFASGWRVEGVEG